jgi:hypothetical protein
MKKLHAVDFGATCPQDSMKFSKWDSDDPSASEQETFSVIFAGIPQDWSGEKIRR